MKPDLLDRADHAMPWGDSLPLIHELAAAVRELDKERQDFYMDYRMQCDVGEKVARAQCALAEDALAKANARLRLAGAGIVTPNEELVARKLAEMVAQANDTAKVLRKELDEAALLMLALRPYAPQGAYSGLRDRVDAFLAVYERMNRK